jgi:hypothetical protein
MTGAKSGASPWDDARSIDDLARATIAFLRGELNQTPSHGAPPDPETAPLVADLIALNIAGFVTTSSQPGDRDPRWPQRAYVQGICSEEVAARIEMGLLGTELVVLSFAPGSTGDGNIAVSLDEGLPFTFLGRRDSAGEAEFYSNGSSALDAVLADVWSLQVFDPAWGRNDRLWPTLTAALAAT